MRSTRFSALCCIVLAGVSLGACNMTTPSRVVTSTIQVEDYMKTVLLPVHSVDKLAVDVAANDYRRNSKSSAALVVPYLKGRKNSMAEAKRAGAAYQKAFAGFGLNVTDVKYAPTLDENAAHNAVLAYTATMAHPPRHCTRMPGARGTEGLESIESYTVGCEMSTLESRMITRPEDLMGVAGSPDSLSRREGPMVEGYMSGRTNPSIQGVTNSSGAVTGGGTSAGQTTTPTSQ